MGTTELTVPYQLAFVASRDAKTRPPRPSRQQRGRRSQVLGALVVVAVVAILNVVVWAGAPARSARLVPAFGMVAVGSASPWQKVTVGNTAPNVGAPEVVLSVDDAAAYAAGRSLVGLVVVDRVTGTYLDNGSPTHTPMGSASVVKVLIAEELLYRASTGELSLGASGSVRMESMLIASDDSAASSLYSQFGGPALIEAALVRHHLSESAPPADPRYWGNTIITAHDVAKFYDNVLAGSISTADQDYLFGLLRRIAPIASDGFDQRFGVNGIDTTSEAAVKQGWMCCLNDLRNVHSTAVLGPDDRYIVVILTQYSAGLPYEYGQDTATEVARLVVEELTL